MGKSFAQNRKESKGVMALLTPLAILYFISRCLIAESLIFFWRTAEPPKRPFHGIYGIIVLRTTFWIGLISFFSFLPSFLSFLLSFFLPSFPPSFLTSKFSCYLICILSHCLLLFNFFRRFLAWIFKKAPQLYHVCLSVTTLEIYRNLIKLLIFHMMG